jgi:hypothetical protein
MKTSRIALATTIAATAALLLSACGGPHAGQVQDKRHSAGHYDSVPTCVMYNSSHLCVIHSTRQVWKDPSWSLNISNGEDQGWVDVTEYRYKSVNVGDYVNLDG